MLPAAAYRIRARYVPNGAWCPWIEVETPDTRVSALDLDAALNSRIDTATSKADAAAADAAAALGKAQDALDQVTTLAGDTIADLEALLAELGGVDAGDIIAARLLGARARCRRAGTPTRRSSSGARAGSTGGRRPGSRAPARPFAGYYGGGLALDVPSGALAATVIASSAVDRADAGGRRRGALGSCSSSW